MFTSTMSFKQSDYPAFLSLDADEPKLDVMCNWQSLRGQLLLQWKRIAARDLDQAGPNRQRIAQLIERKYGVASELVESYLSNFERTMPCR